MIFTRVNTHTHRKRGWCTRGDSDTNPGRTAQTTITDYVWFVRRDGGLDFAVSTLRVFGGGPTPFYWHFPWHFLLFVVFNESSYKIQDICRSLTRSVFPSGVSGRSRQYWWGAATTSPFRRPTGSRSIGLEHVCDPHTGPRSASLSLPENSLSLLTRWHSWSVSSVLPSRHPWRPHFYQPRTPGRKTVTH